MITLTSLSTQLNDQLFGASFSAVPIASRNEGIRQALGQINAAFAATYTISGLDGAATTTLSESFVPVLLIGASANILDFTIRSRLVGYHDTPEVSEKLVPWAEKMKEEFEVGLNQLRIVELQQATNAPAFQTPANTNAYDSTLDTQTIFHV